MVRRLVGRSCRGIDRSFVRGALTPHRKSLTPRGYRAAGEFVRFRRGCDYTWFAPFIGGAAVPAAAGSSIASRLLHFEE
ncbi:MAG: hypothetical protein DWQ08_15005 [Proteobacteria bacterium]|nr:MAG: hypothetical protein DWQ08_15005 [Pseudomonadota bacterium]